MVFARLDEMKYLAYGVFTVFFTVLVAPLWLQIVDPVWDAGDFYYPLFTYLADSIREGRFPLWDPYSNCGDPFHADPQKMAASPLALALGLCVKSTSLGFVILWLLHWWWGGMGMVWLARANRATNAGALTAAVSYAFSGFFIGHAEHTPYIILAAWLPWILGFADKAVAELRLSYALLAAFSYGFCVLCGGYPVLVAFTGFAVALWLVLRYLVQRGGQDEFTVPVAQRMRWITLTLVLMAMVLVGAWAPILNAFFTEARGFTERITPVAADVANFGHPFSHRAALTLFFPFVAILFSPMTTIFDGMNWMLADISMTNAYMGALAIPLAGVWWLRSEERTRPWWLLIFVIFMFLMSLGGYAGVRVVMNWLFPPLTYMRYNAPFRLFWIFPVSLAAGLGFSCLIRQIEARRLLLKMLLGWSVIAGLVAVYVVSFPLRKGIPFMEVFPRIYLPGMIIVPLALLCSWLWVRGSAQVISRIPLLLLLLVLADTGGHLYANNETVWSSGRYPIAELERLHQRETAVYGAPGRRSLDSGAFNIQQILKKPVVAGYVAFTSPDFNDLLVKSRFSELLRASERFWLVPEVDQLPAAEEALKALSSTGMGEPTPVFVDRPGIQLPSKRVVPGSYGSARTLFYSPEEIRLEVIVPPGGKEAFLASTERYAAGWKVWVDGSPQQVWKANMYFRGVFLPEGRHNVIWRYEPQLWSLLVFLSYAVITVTLVGALLLMARESQARALPSSHKADSRSHSLPMRD